jgi:sugar/nucleoside kinase (ribokinase family)
MDNTCVNGILDNNYKYSFMEKEYDVIGIGNPLLDIIVDVDEAALLAHGLKKGSMHLVDGVQRDNILKALEQQKKAYISGGSAANTVSGMTLLGGTGMYVGVIGDDGHGVAYEDEMKNDGVDMRLSRHETEQTGC